MYIKQFTKEIVIFMLTLIMASGAYMLFEQYTYHDTSNPQAALKRAAQTHSVTTLIFHKTGCPDCKSVVTAINRGIKDNPNSNYVVVDTKHSKLYQHYNVETVPTIIRLVDGHEVSRYSGTSKREIANILTDNVTR